MPYGMTLLQIKDVSSGNAIWKGTKTAKKTGKTGKK